MHIRQTKDLSARQPGMRTGNGPARRAAALLTVIAMALLTIPVWAEGPPAAAPAAEPVTVEHAHDGFLLRLMVGGGYGSWSAERDDLSFSGSGARIMAMSFAIGGCPIENLAIHFTYTFQPSESDTLSTKPSDLLPEEKAALVSSMLDDSTLTYCDSGCSPGESAMRIDLLLGLGATYFLPSNTYASLSVGFATSILSTKMQQYGNWGLETVEVDGSAEGWGAELLLGQEWWVSRDWGLGLALEGLCATSSAAEADHLSCAGNLLFSATYN